MNILTDVLPSTITVDGVDVTIRTDFRHCLRALMACEDNELTPQEKHVAILLNIYPEAPEDIVEALDGAIWFLDGGKEGSQGEGDGVRLFSFSKDANLIYAAFRQTHGIDLSAADLHWWQFLALFMDLGQDTAFCQLTALRSRVKRGKATKEERQAAREMGEAFDVPDMDDRTLEEKELEQAFMKLVGANHANK